VQEAGDPIAVREERRLCLRCGVAVAGLGRFEHRDSGIDVALEQGGQPATSLAPVEGLHGVADIGLVAEQPLDGELRSWS
jgi:hypothetical protein